MSTNINLFDVTFQANRAIDQYRLVDIAGDFAVTYGAGVRPAGVAQRDTRSGQSVPVAVIGISRVQAGGTIVAGQLFSAQSGTGFALAVASGAAPGQAPHGRALTGAASGFLFSGFIFGATSVASGVAG